MPSMLRPKSSNDLGHVVRVVSRFVADQQRLFGLALVMLVAEAATAVFEAYPLAYLIDYLKGDRPDLLTVLHLEPVVSPLIGTIAILTTAIILTAAINSAADSLAEIFLARGGRMLGYNLRLALYAHLQRLSLAFHDQRRTGDVLTRVTSDVAALEEFVIRSLSDIVGSVLVLIGTLAFLMYRSWEVSLVAAVVVPVMAVVSDYFSQRIKAASKKQRAREGDLASAAQEMLTSIRVIQSYSRATYEQTRFAAHNRKAMAAALEAAGHQARFSWVIKVLGALVIATVVWLGLWMMESTNLTVGTLLLFILLIQNMFKPTRKIIREWNTFGKIYASVERIGELLDRRPTVVERPHAITAPPLKGQIEFRGVSFAYQPDPDLVSEASEPPRPALKNVSVEIAAGEVVALVGPTGAGKSTIAQLLPRLYDPGAGQICIDGQDLRDFTLDSLRSQISLVLQETILFSGTVAENITYGRPEATRAEVAEAARQANAHEFIEKLPEGYDTLLGERGANLSGGQRQRIAIARAFIRNTPILILDEPTTGLDAEAAELVLRALHTLMQNKTTIIISHDLKLIRHADKIVVIEAGEIVQVGMHEALLRSPGLYAGLYLKQFGLAEAELASSDRMRPTAELHAEPPAARQDTILPTPLAGTQAPPFDLLQNSLIQRQLPGLATAFEAEVMREHLQAALIDQAQGCYTIERCTPGKFTYLGEAGCALRYELAVRDRASGEVLEQLVNAWVFPSRLACETYVRERLAPLAARLGGRTEMAPFTRPVAMLDALPMAVSVFPIDGELPMLVTATDRQRMIEIFRETLPRGVGDDLFVEECRVDLGHYGRQHRCVLRYEVEGRRPGIGAAERRVVYGKVAADGRGLLSSQALEALHERMQAKNGGAHRFSIPRSLGFVPELQLALMEAIPGRACIGQLITARMERVSDAEAGTPTLEEALEVCALVAAELHTSNVTLGPWRTLADELAALRPGILAVHAVSPELGARLLAWLEQLEAYAGETDPLPLCFSHGDFTYTQLVFDGAAGGLVDFDTVCQAEPALDLGQFLAYLRVAVLKARENALGAEAALDEQLCAWFLNTYLTASYYPWPGDEQLRGRVSVYELVSLLRLAMHSWRKSKNRRLEHALAVLEERVSCLP